MRHRRSKMLTLSTVVCLSMLFGVNALAKNKLTQLTGLKLSEPANLTRVIGWGDNALRTLYTYDFVNYRRQIENAALFFTPQGWKAYTEVFRESNSLFVVKEKKFVVSTTFFKRPIVLRQGIREGRYYWDIKYFARTRYENINEVIVVPLVIVLSIVRTDATEGYQGLGITAFHASKFEKDS